MDYPLKGLRVLDFTCLLPGPYGSMMLADMGAEIIKVENMHSPDLARFMPPLVNGMSAFYAHLNRGKRSLSLDLKKDHARDIVYRLVKDYDIVLEQFRPGVMSRLGLGYDDLKKINPAVIYCSLTGYGQNGEYAHRAGHDINYCALSGIDSYSGRKGTGPLLSGIQIADICSGSKNLVIAVLAACFKRNNTGQGDYCDISITDGTFALSLFAASGYLVDGMEPEQEGQLFNGGSLYDYYRTKDGRYLAAGPLELKFFRDFCAMIGREDLAELGIMANLADPSIKQEVADIIAAQPLSYWIERCCNLDACSEPVRTMSEACGSSLFNSRDMIITVTDNSGNSIKQMGNPIKFKSGHYYAHSSAVECGFDNDAVLGECGFTAEEITDMRKNGIVK